MAESSSSTPNLVRELLMAESSSSSSPNLEWSYDVFLNFRGEDTRTNFTSHLDTAFCQNKVNFFIDDKLKRGGQISEALLNSIQGSRISIVIFSPNYASSTWCLDELEKIIECMKSKRQIVLPVFYKVDPSEVRKQTGRFGQALAVHQAKFMTTTKVQTWKEALTIAAGLSGWDLGTRKEADLIQDLVKQVLSILNHTYKPLYVGKYPVGIDSQLEQLNFLSQYSTQHFSDGVDIVGIWGMGGSGKTTLAKALYNKIANQFEGCCFLSNVHQASKQFNGLVQLQEKLLYEILKDDLKVDSLYKGMNILRNRLCSRKVLIVLDDVFGYEELEALVGGRDWLGRGSKIIVTTRDRHLLSFYEVYKMHEMKLLDQDNALELFSWHAFKESHPPNNYLDLSKHATSYCKGSPLFLVVLGSFLCTRDRSKWRSILDKFENSSDTYTDNILYIIPETIFGGLEDRVKDIFLDICCFFVGEKVNCVRKILSTCHLNLDLRIIDLMELSLIMIDENDKVQMHDLIQYMGHHYIVNQGSLVPGKRSSSWLVPGKRSRLWRVKEVLEIFTDDSGTDTIEAIKLDLPNPTRLDVDARAFRKMKNLRLLIVRNARFSTDPEYLPNNLKWIKWHGFAQPSSLRCFMTKNLVGLDLQHASVGHYTSFYATNINIYVVYTNSKIDSFHHYSHL